MAGVAARCGPVTERSRLWKSAGDSFTIAPIMSGMPVHQPPSPAVIAELMRCGVSHSTAMAMERWKAQEVLDLLRSDDRHDRHYGSIGHRRGTI